jgi:alpha-beta hydrolase superfamily lysophospholipase
VANAISKIMDTYPGDQKFSIIAHSMGSLVGYLATHSKKFPVEKLANFFSLASALEESPQLFNGEITEILRKVTTTYNEHLWNNVVHLNFHGAARD